MKVHKHCKGYYPFQHDCFKSLRVLRIDFCICLDVQGSKFQRRIESSFVDSMKVLVELTSSGIVAVR